MPAFRLGSQKSPWLISAIELAALIDERAGRARKEWARLQNVP
ncbi:pyocin activator PrtN family protein [Lysobacter enzymogenes]